MRKPTWHRDWAGFSGGWYSQSDERPRDLTVLGVYGFGYFLDVCAPVIGDVRIGYQTRAGRENPYRSPRSTRRAFVFERRGITSASAVS